MNTRIWQVCAVVVFLAGSVASAQVQVVVKTQAGLVAGSGTEVRVWKGIPYARPPVGDLRWGAPQPPVQWQGIRHTLEFGPMCPQGDPAQLKPDMNEDCLNLNVWSGAKGERQLPVLVWIHGDGFVGGSNRMNGEPLARSGIVVVSINYRLGMLGFMAHPDLTRESGHRASGNYGLMDQIAALHWVQNNIAEFGGDPHRVTIGGVSAGGTSVGYLMASPLARGLFQGAWLDSASRLFLPDPRLSEPFEGLTPMEQVGLQIAPHIQELRALSTSEVMKRGAQATDELFGEGGRGRVGLKPESHVHLPNEHDRPWWAFTDGYVMPAELDRMFASGRFNHVVCLIGTCKDEGLVFTRRMPDLTVEAYRDYLRKYYPAISSKMFEMYPATMPDEIRDAVSRTITDYMFLYGSLRAADFESAAGEPVYVERFVRLQPGAPGVAHGTDADYFLGDVKIGKKRYDADDEKLSAEMMKCMVAFVTSSAPTLPEPSPEWPTWTPKHPQYLEIGNEMQPRSFRDQAVINLFRKQLRQ